MAIKINGQVIQLVQNVEGTDADTIIEIDNSDGIGNLPQVRITDVNETDPAGRFRLIVSGDTIELQGSTKANWETSRTLLKFDRNGQTAALITEDGMIDLLDQLVLHVMGGSGMTVKLRQLFELVLTD